VSDAKALTFRPSALSNVKTMPPTMMTLSAFSSSVLMTSILDDTCAATVLGCQQCTELCTYRLF
jgi:hypothetical protein